MAAKNTQKRRKQQARRKLLLWLAERSWEEWDQRFGSRSCQRGMRYHEQGRVLSVAWAKGGGVVGVVRGAQPYRTELRLEARRGLVDTCSCPLGGSCKHGFALVLELLRRIEEKGAVQELELPEAGEGGLDELMGSKPAMRGTRASRRTHEPASPERSKLPKSSRSTQPPKMPELRRWLEARPHEELVERLLSQARRDSELLARLVRDYRVEHRQSPGLVADTRRLIEEITQEEYYERYDHFGGSWDDEGPDYSRVQGQFESLAEMGEHEELLLLGRLLFERGRVQLDERVHDQGHTAIAIGDCLEVAFASLSKAKSPPLDRMNLAFELILADDFDLLPACVDRFLERRHSKAVWEQFADHWRIVLDELDADGRDTYRRGQLVRMLVSALERTGRSNAAEELAMREARRGSDYRLVLERLREQGRIDEAEQLLVEVHDALPPEQDYRKQELREELARCAEEKGDKKRVAAFAAEAFFREPSSSGFERAMQAAKAVRLGKPVRAWLVQYLTTGRCPLARGFRWRKSDPEPWPLPATGLEVEPGLADDDGTQSCELLLKLAILEKRGADVLRHWDRLRELEGAKGRDGRALGGRRELGFVAEAIAKHAPERAIELWLEEAHSRIARRIASEYPLAVKALRSIRDLLLPQQRERWEGLLRDFRDAYPRLRRLQAELNVLTLSPQELAHRSAKRRR
jgi:uncharacterized Zn finger protein